LKESEPRGGAINVLIRRKDGDADELLTFQQFLLGRVVQLWPRSRRLRGEIESELRRSENESEYRQQTELLEGHVELSRKVA
jgi:hypothetical protein